MYKELQVLEEEHFKIMEEIEANGGELDEELEEKYDAMVANMAKTTDRFVEVIKYLEHLAKVQKEKASIHQAKARSLDNKIKSLKGKAIQLIKEGVDFDTDAWKITVQCKKTPKIYYSSYDEVPKEYVSYEPKVNMNQWVKDIKNGVAEKPKGFHIQETEFITIRG